VDGADEVHQMTIAKGAIAAWKDHGAMTSAHADLPL
jgi:hypothetical protein